MSNTNPTGSKKKAASAPKEPGPKFTPKSTVKSFSTCYITFQRQLKAAKKKWDREFELSKGEVK